MQNVVVKMRLLFVSFGFRLSQDFEVFKQVIINTRQTDKKKWVGGLYESREMSVEDSENRSGWFSCYFTDFHYLNVLLEY
jgi:hypothetical protein